MEFSKKILIVDYTILALMVIAFFVLVVLGHDTTNCAVVIGAWVAQTAVSSGFYFWKSKAENLVKLPIYMLKNLPDDMREKADPNQIIASVLGIGRSE